MATFVLIAGAWHGAWCWEKLKPFLERQGHRVLTPDLPGMGADRTPFADDVLGQWTDAITAMVEAQAEPVILLGHSRGGLIVSTVSERVPERVALAVYLAAIMLADGETVLDAHVLTDDALSELKPTEDGRAYAIDPGYARKWFYPRATPADAEWAIARLTPEPMQPSAARLSLSDARFGRVSRAFIETTDDKGYPVAKQREMQRRWPVDHVVTLDSDHAPFLSMPERLAQALNRLAETSLG